MVIEIDYGKCGMCGAYDEPICIDNCPTTAISQRDKKLQITEFLCEDCNECGFRCPDRAIKIKEVTF